MNESNLFFHKNFLNFLNSKEIEVYFVFDSSYDPFLKKTVFNVERIDFIRHDVHLSYNIAEIFYFPTENDLIDDIRNRFKIFDPVDFQKGE